MAHLRLTSFASVVPAAVCDQRKTIVAFRALYVELANTEAEYARQRMFSACAASLAPASSEIRLAMSNLHLQILDKDYRATFIFHVRFTPIDGVPLRGLVLACQKNLRVVFIAVQG